MPEPISPITPPAWTDAALANPHHTADKRARVQRMFSAIAPKYDLNNRLHSFWRDQAWRRTAVKMAELKPNDRVVDVACGTGDLTLAFASALAGRTVLGIDFTHAMLPIAYRKSSLAHRTCLFAAGDAQQLPLPDACCDVVSIAFGIRNVQNVPAAMAEFRRVLRPGGRLIVLEFSEPTHPLLRVMNRFYTGRVMPLTATLISGDRSGAYKYLPKSVETFMTRQQMIESFTAAGFSQIVQKPLTFGVCVCYRGMK